MPEYIDKDKLLNAIECIDISNCTDVDDIFIEIERTIDEQPAADVVEVVRCKNCKYFIIKSNYRRLKERQQTFIGDEYTYKFIYLIEIDNLVKEYEKGR